MDKLKSELNTKLIEAQNKYDEYKVRYEDFCNKPDWDDVYDHIAENAMGVYLSKLLLDVEIAKMELEQLEVSNG